MKILAALKRIKHLDRKITKTLKRIGKYCSVIVDNDNDDDPIYDEGDVRKMQQQIGDWAESKGVIRHGLHLTNVRTKTKFAGKEMSIDELLVLQNVIMPEKMKALKVLSRKEKGGYGNTSSKDSWVIIQYNPKQRDMDIEALELSMEELDTLLDDLNIETDVVGL
jgi:hypothetical protein